MQQRFGYAGKWTLIPNRDGTVYFTLKASNGEELLKSIAYANLRGSKKGMETYKRNIANDKFTINKSRNGQYYFILKSGNGRILYTSTRFKNRANCEYSIESVKRFSQTAILVRQQNKK